MVIVYVCYLKSCVKLLCPGGGVYPEVLYNVARYWYELYLRQASEESEPLLEEPQYRAPPPVALPVPYPLPYPFTYHPYPPPIYQLQVSVWVLIFIIIKTNIYI